MSVRTAPFTIDIKYELQPKKDSIRLEPRGHHSTAIKVRVEEQGIP